MGRTCSTRREVRNIYKILVRTPDRKKHHGRHRCKLKDNINMDVTGIRLDSIGSG
jgi:hypothetical protein